MAAVALARVVGWPRGPPDDRPVAVPVVGRRSTPFAPSCGSEAAPSGPGVSWGWLAATPRPGGACVADLVTTVCRFGSAWCIWTYFVISEIKSREITPDTCDLCVQMIVIESVVDVLWVGDR